MCLAAKAHAPRIFFRFPFSSPRKDGQMRLAEQLVEKGPHCAITTPPSHHIFILFHLKLESIHKSGQSLKLYISAATEDDLICK